jgi:hypothetical protein
MKRTAKNPSRLPNHGGLVLGLFLIVACIPFPADSEELGRLFFTPERRQLLDRQRQFNIQERKEIPEDPTLTINGVVTRSSGKRTVWINGVAQEEASATDGAIIIPERKNPGRVTLRDGETAVTDIGVGSSINRTTGESADVIGNGSIQVYDASNRSKQRR